MPVKRPYKTLYDGTVIFASSITVYETHHFTPIAIETGGSWKDLAIEFITELRKRITAVTQESRETQYLFRRMSVALQRGNAAAFQNTFPVEH